MKFRFRIGATAYLTLFLASASFAQLTSDGANNARSTSSTANIASRPWTRQTEDFVPMTSSERAAHYAYSLIGPQAFVYSAAVAGFKQIDNTPKEWRQGAEGYGRRYGSAYAQHFISATIENGIAFRLHEDNRYFASGKTGAARLGYAITSSFLARHDDGSRSLSLSGIGGTAAGAFVSRTWQPSSDSSMSSAAASFGIAMGVRVGLNVAREFLPKALGGLLK